MKIGFCDGGPVGLILRTIRRILVFFSSNGFLMGCDNRAGFTRPSPIYFVSPEQKEEESTASALGSYAFSESVSSGNEYALKIAAIVTRIVDFLRGNEWLVRMPNGSISTTFLNRPDQQLAFLQLAREVNPDRFSTAYDISRVLLSSAAIAPISLEVLSEDSYFKFNIDSIMP